MASFTGKAINLGQLHEELAQANPVPDGWGLKLDGTAYTEMAGIRVPIDGAVMDTPPTLDDAIIQAAVDAHTADMDYGVDPDRLQLRDNALSQLDGIIANVQGYNLAQTRNAVRRLAQIERRMLRQLFLKNPDEAPATPD